MTTLARLVEKHLKGFRGLSADRRRQYHRAVDAMRRTLGREPTKNDLRDESLAAVAAALQARGLRASTINQGTLSPLRAVWRSAIRRGEIKHWYGDVYLPVQPTPPTPWSRGRLATLWSALEGAKGFIGDCPASLWWLALHGPLYDVGCKVGLLVQTRETRRPPPAPVQWDDLDLDRCELNFQPNRRCRGSRTGPKRLDVTTVELIERMGRGKGPIFHYPGSRESLYRHYGRILQRAGLPCDARGRMHRFAAIEASSFAEAAGKTGVGQSLADFLEECVAPDLANSSADQLRLAATRFGDFLRRRPMVRDLSSGRIEWFARWRSEQGAAPRTVRNVRSGLVRLAGTAAAAGLVAPAPNAAVGKRIPIAPSVAAFAAVEDWTPWDDPGGQTIADYLERRYLPARSLRPASAKQFRLSVDKLALFLDRDPRLHDLAAEILNPFILHRSAGVSPRTARNDSDHLWAIAKAAYADGLIPPPGDVYRPKLPAKTRAATPNQRRGAAV